MAVRRRPQEPEEALKEKTYPEGSDLHHLWSWGYRIEDWLYSDDFSISEIDWVLIRPHRPAAEAMLAFSVDFVGVVNELKACELEVEKRWEEVLSNENDATRFSYTDALDVLCSRIRKACEVIAEKTQAKDSTATGAHELENRQSEVRTMRTVRTDKKLFPKGDLDDSELQEAIQHLHNDRTSDNKAIDLLREITGEGKDSSPKAKALAARIRKARGDGRTSLPPQK